MAQLPTIRSLAEELGVSHTTVATAYKDLRQRGTVVSRGRNGTVVAARPAVKTQVTTAVDRPGLTDLSSGNPDPALLIPADLLGSGDREGHVLYGAPAVLPELQDVAQARFSADGIPADWLIVTNGSLDAIERVLTAHLRFGDRVAVEDPGYFAVLDLVQAMGYTAVPVEVDDEGLVPATLERALDAGLDAVVLTPRAQNPTGAAISARRAAALRDVLSRHPGVLVVEDDHAADIVSSAATWLGSAVQHWIVVRSLSKAIDPDLRIAVSVGDPATIGRIAGRFALGAGWVSHRLQRMAAVAWSDERVRERLDRAMVVYDERREALRAALAGYDVRSLGSTGFNIWVPCRDEAHVVSYLADQGWRISAGTRYRQRSAPGVRITTSSLRPAQASRVAMALASALGVPARAGGTRTG